MDSKHAAVWLALIQVAQVAHGAGGFNFGANRSNDTTREKSRARDLQ